MFYCSLLSHVQRLKSTTSSTILQFKLEAEFNYSWRLSCAGLLWGGIDCHSWPIRIFDWVISLFWLVERFKAWAGWAILAETNYSWRLSCAGCSEEGSSVTLKLLLAYIQTYTAQLEYERFVTYSFNQRDLDKLARITVIWICEFENRGMAMLSMYIFEYIYN